MHILEVKNVTKKYAAHTALKNVSLTVPEGKIFGLLGPNGAGKTSLIRIITQITGADEGEVRFKDRAMHKDDIFRIGYLPEERGLYRKMEVGEQLIYFARLKGMSRNEAIQKLKVWVEKFEIKSWWNKKVEELSKGMQQKIQFIATVLHNPDLVILDEPFSGFDPINAGLITEEILSLKARGCAVIFSTHRMESVEQLCDYIALINRSEKVLEGEVNEIRKANRTGIYNVVYSGPEWIDHHFDILESKKVNDGYQTSVHLKREQSTNDLLKSMIPACMITSLEEKIPSMQEIFIKSVSGSQANA